jgi:hypothetical protein
METSDNPLRVFTSAFSDTSEFQDASVEDDFQLMLLNATGKYSVENIQFEAVLVIISIVATLIYLGVCIGRVFLGVPTNGLFDTVLMFLFSEVVSLDGYIFAENCTNLEVCPCCALSSSAEKPHVLRPLKESEREKEKEPSQSAKR